MIGAKIQMRTMKPTKMFAIAHQGTIRGEPMYATCDQSKVILLMPRPVTTPNN